MSPSVCCSEMRADELGRLRTSSSYIYKVLKQVHPETGISNKAMSVMNTFVYDQFDKIGAFLPPFRSFAGPCLTQLDIPQTAAEAGKLAA